MWRSRRVLSAEAPTRSQISLILQMIVSLIFVLFFFGGGGVGGGGKLGGGRSYILTLQSKNYIRMDPLNSFALSFKVHNFLLT